MSRTRHLQRVDFLIFAVAGLVLPAHSSGARQSAPVTPPAPPTVAPACGTEALKRYFNSGKYLRNIAQTAELGRVRLQEKLAALSPTVRPAVIFDIDETLLSTWPILLSGDFCFDEDRFAAFIDQGDAPVIQPVRELFQFALEKKAAIFLITSRTEKHRPATEANLKATGLSGYQELIMQPDDPATLGREYKRSARQHVIECGLEIVMSVGDQLGDLGDVPGCYGLLIPNPFYTTE